MGNKKTKEPLLYINQPTLETPKAFMQENYSSLTKRKEEVTNPPIKEQVNRERRPRKNPFFDMLEEEADSVELSDEDELEHTDDKVEQSNQKKNSTKFNNLSIQGKIDYFVDLPIEMPKIQSEIELENDVFRGYILEDNGAEITMKTGRVVEEIKKEDIKNIILIGF